MKKVPVNQLQTGMVLGKTVYSTDGQVLFMSGTVIDEHKINQLLTLDINLVDITDSQTTIRQDKELTRKEIIRTVKGIFQDITIKNQTQQGMIHQTLNKILRRVIKNRCAMLCLTEMRNVDLYIFSHSVNVCMLSLILGMFLKLKGEDLRNLGLAALLHDVGRTRVPPDILYKPGLLNPDEFAQVKKHPLHGYEIIKSCGQFPEIVALTALQHHERLDGSGYPAGRTGAQIELFARIVGICDVFDALLANRPFRKAFFPHQAVEIIINSPNQFDADILKVFLDSVIIYPLGAMVNLSNGESGIVVDMNKGYQTRPVVRVLYDQQTQKLDNVREIDLSKSTDVYITNVLE
jgi:HD-GYP domain-containing protein (c-di-GMP phosphodiesterase class II)